MQNKYKISAIVLSCMVISHENVVLASEVSIDGRKYICNHNDVVIKYYRGRGDDIKFIRELEPGACVLEEAKNEKMRNYYSFENGEVFLQSELDYRLYERWEEVILILIGFMLSYLREIIGFFVKRIFRRGLVVRKINSFKNKMERNFKSTDKIEDYYEEYKTIEMLISEMVFFPQKKVKELEEVMCIYQDVINEDITRIQGMKLLSKIKF